MDINFDDPVKNRPSVMPDFILHPETVEITIFQLLPELRNMLFFDFLRNHGIIDFDIHRIRRR